VAAPCPDGSSIYYNPAAIAFVQGQELGLGGSIIGPRGDFTNSTTGLVSSLNDKYYPVPHFFYAQNVGTRFAAGVGLFAPYGLTTDWPDTSEGRFLGYKSLVQGIYTQPTLAVRVNDKVAVGLGVDITYLNVELRQRVDLSQQFVAPGVPFSALGVRPGADFADVDLKGHAWHVGFNAGVQVKANDLVSFGARWMSGQRVDVTNGDFKTTQIMTGLRTPIPLGPTIPAGTPLDALLAPQFASGGSLSNQTASTQLPLPDQVVAGVAIQATPKLKLLADYQFVRWSMFDQLAINKQYGSPVVLYESYNDTSGVRIGAEYAITSATTVRGGFIANQAAAPDQSVTPNLPEASRKQFSVGIGNQFGKSVRFDAYYLFLDQSDRAGRTVNGPTIPPTAAANNGTYHFLANLFGAMLAFRF
jgi:long-chain fatty acid transport protein